MNTIFKELGKSFWKELGETAAKTLVKNGIQAGISITKKQISKKLKEKDSKECDCQCEQCNTESDT